MNEIKLNLSIHEDNIMTFKKVVRKLLSSTNIVGDKDEDLFSFLTVESNRLDVSDYLRLIGYDVLVDTDVRIAKLYPCETDAETVGLKRANLITFTSAQYHLLILLWQLYLENLGSGEVTSVTLGTVVDRIKAYDVDMDKAKLSAALKLFRKYDLIEYSMNTFEADESVITLYPSLQFGWNVAQFASVAREHISGLQALPEEEYPAEEDPAEENDADDDIAEDSET